VPPTVTMASTFTGKADWQTDFSATGTDVSPEDAASLTYAWNFGDGSTGTGADPTHEYTTAGTYNVTVTVTDKNGFTASAAATANIASLGPDPNYIVTPYLNIPDFGYEPTIVSVQSGNWSNPATWSLDRVPQAGDIVDIQPGTTVTYNVDDTTDASPLNTVEVKAGATLSFSTSANTQMYVVNLMVLQGGTLNIGTLANPMPANITATVVWVNQAINTSATTQLTIDDGVPDLSTVPTLPANTVLDPEQYGNGLIVLGNINTYGVSKAPYVTLAQNALAGATALYLASPATGWQVGDELELPDTRQLDSSDESGAYTPEYETDSIAGISANGLTIYLSGMLEYNHLGGYNAAGDLEYLPQVLDLTRNVMFHSQSASGTRGYALFTGNANVNINYTTFGGMGRTSDVPFDTGVANNVGLPQDFDNTTFDANGNITNLGTNEGDRNAITFLNLIGPSSPQTDGYQFTFNGNTVTCPLNPMPYIWGVTVVNSYYGLIENNDVVNWAGSGVMADAASSYNNFTGNFVMRINGTGGRGSTDMGFGGNGFWFGNSNNTVTNNIVTDLNPNGPYGYAYEFYASGDPGGFIGYETIPAYQGADPSQPGQSQSVDMNLVPILDFSNNEAYGVVCIGMSYWSINFNPPPGVSVLSNAGVIKDFVAWNVFSTGIYGYEATNVTIDGFVCLGSAAELAAGFGAAGMQFQDYEQGNLVITNADIEDEGTGILAPDNTYGNVTIENSYLANEADVVVSGLWSVSFYAPPRTIIINNDQFVAPAGGEAWYAVYLNWYAPFQLAGGMPILQSDQVLVYNYNGVSGDNFQVFYTQQAANFIVPQEMVSDGSLQPLSGAPVAGLTNAQCWAQYGIAIAGAVAPSDTTTMNNINTMVAPIS
jgi:PKD domain/G8 domain